MIKHKSVDDPFHDIYSNIEDAAIAIKKRIARAVCSRQESIKKLARILLKSHIHAVLRYFTSHLEAGALEGINRRIQQIKIRAKGYLNMNRFSV